MGSTLGGAIIFGIGGGLGLVIALVHLSLDGLVGSLVILFAAVGLWRWTVHDVRDWIRLKKELDF